MVNELGQISFYLAKAGSTFDAVLDSKKIPPVSDSFQIRNFNVDGVEARFLCELVSSSKSNPPWIEFINDQLSEDADKINYEIFSKRPSGLLLLMIENRVFAAAFGTRGASYIKKSEMLHDFGIKTAMNMCGNEDLRQTKSSVRSFATQNISRQLSLPSDTSVFGLSDTEFLKYISGHVDGDRKISLQGKDNLTLKIIGEEKLNWPRLVEYCKQFLIEYGKDTYKTLFPNYLNLQEVSDEEKSILDKILIGKIKDSDFDNIHLSIPEFIADDEFSFTYSNYENRENNIYSYLDIEQISNVYKNLKSISVDKLIKKFIYAYSSVDDQILEHKKWSIYSCLVSEIEHNSEHFILTEGRWQKVDNDFYKQVNSFIEKKLNVEKIPNQFKNIDIADGGLKQNREEIFNEKYCAKNENSIKFDKAKLKISQSEKNKEFCDILEHSDAAPMNIIHVKQYGNASSINYLFSQAKFYCEFFLTDLVFLEEIRNYIGNSGNKSAPKFLDFVKEEINDVKGSDYQVSLWLLFDNKKAPPTASDLPLMAKYELKLTCERLMTVNKYKAVSISFIPVKKTKFKTAKKK